MIEPRARPTKELSERLMQWPAINCHARALPLSHATNNRQSCQMTQNFIQVHVLIKKPYPLLFNKSTIVVLAAKPMCQRPILKDSNTIAMQWCLISGTGTPIRLDCVRYWHLDSLLIVCSWQNTKQDQSLDQSRDSAQVSAIHRKKPLSAIHSKFSSIKSLQSNIIKNEIFFDQHIDKHMVGNIYFVGLDTVGISECFPDIDRSGGNLKMCTDKVWVGWWDFYLRENIWNGNLARRCFMQISVERRKGFCGIF